MKKGREEMLREQKHPQKKNFGNFVTITNTFSAR
jgi:hypothetical protein